MALDSNLKGRHLYLQGATQAIGHGMAEGPNHCEDRRDGNIRHGGSDRHLEHITNDWGDWGGCEYGTSRTSTRVGQINTWYLNVHYGVRAITYLYLACYLR